MKIKLLEDSLIAAYQDKELDMLEYAWKPATMTMVDDDFRNVINFWLNISPALTLVDSREWYWTISPEIQTWLNMEIYPEAFKRGSRKIAMILPRDIIVSISVQQNSDMSKEHGTVIFEYFENENEAKQWLFNKNLKTKEV